VCIGSQGKRPPSYEDGPVCPPYPGPTSYPGWGMLVVRQPVTSAAPAQRPQSTTTEVSLAKPEARPVRGTCCSTRWARHSPADGADRDGVPCLPLVRHHAPSHALFGIHHAFHTCLLASDPWHLVPSFPHLWGQTHPSIELGAWNDGNDRRAHRFHNVRGRPLRGRPRPPAN
jgi:hypothetical protein